jgi:hypothetical protein
VIKVSVLTQHTSIMQQEINQSTNQQQELPVVDMFVNRSGRIEQSL